MMTRDKCQLQEEFENLGRQFQDHPHIRLVLRCEEALTHNIYAGADIFVIPSIFEPCGLTQVISNFLFLFLLEKK